MITPEWVECPAEIRTALEPMLTRWLVLLPTWCQRLVILYGATENNTMSVEILHRNRWASIKVAGQWLDQPQDEREEALVHELVHVCMEPLVAASRRMVEDLTEEGTPLRELADSMMCDGMECSVEDTARAILRVRAAA